MPNFSHLDFLSNNAHLLLAGIRLSLMLTLIGIIGGITAGTLLALLRLFGGAPGRLFVRAYVYLFRAIPLLLVIFWFYFLVPVVLGHPVGALRSAIVAFILFEAAYYSEIIRSGIASVSRGQFNAGLAVGMGRLQTMGYIVLPQAFKAMIPVFLTQGVILFQDTSLVFVVSLHDFMTACTVIADRDGHVVEVYGFCCLIYYLICMAITFLVNQVKGGAYRDSHQ